MIWPRLALGLLLFARLGATEIEVPAYRQQLIDLAQHLAAGDERDVASDSVRWPDGQVTPTDPTLATLLRNHRRAAAQRRIAAILDCLPAKHVSAVPITDDLAALRTQVLPAPVADGGSLLGPELSFPDEDLPWTQWFVHAGEWFVDQARTIWHALRDWLGSNPSKPEGSYTGALWWVCGSIVMLITVTVILALRRQATPPSAWPASAVIAGAGDEDPLSRHSDDWVALAQRLTSEGRLREAVRAWYHAVLTGAFAAGHLHHRTGRTNWEYLGALSPSLTWHRSFASLTQRFDRVWYGHHETADESNRMAEEAGDVLNTFMQETR